MISTPSELSLSPESSPTATLTLVPAFFTPRPARQQPSLKQPISPNTVSSEDEMAPQKTVELFRGNCVSEKAHTWLRTLEGTWKFDTKEEEKLYQFEKGLHPGGQADEWWEELKAGEKDTWKNLLTAFEKKWPKPKTTRRATEAIIEELNTNTLDLHALGKYVKDKDGNSVLTHVAWAEGTGKLLMELPNGDDAVLLKSHICSTLPVAFRCLISDASLDSWEKWLRAVENVPLDAIRDAREDYETLHPTQELTNGLSLTHLSPARIGTTYGSPRTAYIPPAARLSQSPARPPPAATPYSTPAPAAYPPRTPWNARTDNVFGGSTIRLPNTFTKHWAFNSPVSPLAGRSRPTSLSGDPARDADIARNLAQNARTYLADQNGMQRYKADMDTWMSQYGNSTSPDYSTFPFAPGTATLGSRECYRGGLLTVPPHYGQSACKILNNPEVPIRELNIRTVVCQIMYPPRQRGAGISQINEVPYDLFSGFDPNQPLYDAQSENGEEPTE
ncbi:hypothetical protein K438DRAFT_1874593 [Mycena galopus ATCC 62051]|nr:hypothetical protein K438DRAFT_1874593 [Mycena galopus ATCC 62051]